VQGIRTEGEAHDVAYKVCTLVDRGGEREGAFRVNNSIDLLAGILLALALDPRGQASLGRARQVAHMPILDFAKFTDAHPNVPVLGRVCELYHDAHQTGACVFQDLRMRLSGFMDEPRPAYDLPLLAQALDEPAPCVGESRVARLKRQLGWDALGRPAREAWRALEAAHAEREIAEGLEGLEGLREVWGQLKEPKPTLLEDSLTARRQSRARQLRANLCFLQYRLLTRHEELQRLQEDEAVPGP
jgi:hypothetical protein